GIKSLDFQSTKITDEAMRYVALQKDLRELIIKETAVTDSGVEKLRGLDKLEKLDMYKTKITGQTLPPLNLKELYARESIVTNAGLQ
ncbi:hypothetical protein ABTC63_21715, partial [Acinetobacter baumannii]